MKKLKLPEQSAKYVQAQRTDYDPAIALKAYSDEMLSVYNNIKDHLPETKTKPKIIDIGCGMAGIDAFISYHYNNEADITLLDIDGEPDNVGYGFVSVSDMSSYHNFDLALKQLEMNGVPSHNILTHDISKNLEFPSNDFDVVISLISWGFHYPIDTYSVNLSDNGVVIVDVRKDTDGLDQLAEIGPITVISEKQKYHRVVVKKRR